MTKQVPMIFQTDATEYILVPDEEPPPEMVWVLVIKGTGEREWGLMWESAAQEMRKDVAARQPAG